MYVALASSTYSILAFTQWSEYQLFCPCPAFVVWICCSWYFSPIAFFWKEPTKRVSDAALPTSLWRIRRSLFCEFEDRLVMQISASGRRTEQAEVGWQHLVLLVERRCLCYKECWPLTEEFWLALEFSSCYCSLITMNQFCFWQSLKCTIESLASTQSTSLLTCSDTRGSLRSGLLFLYHLGSKTTFGALMVETGFTSSI